MRTKSTAPSRNREKTCPLQRFIDLVLDPPTNEDDFFFDPVIANTESDHAALMEVADQTT